MEIKRTTNRYNRLLKNTGMLFVGNFVSKILSFFMVPFYTSVLTTSDYGTADLITTVVLLVLPAFSVLMECAVMRFTLEQTTDRKQVFTIAFVVSTAGFLVAICISPVVLLWEPLRQYYGFVIMYYVVSWVYNIVSSYVKGLDKLSITTIAGVIHTFAFLGLNIFFLAICKIGVHGYLLSINLSNLISIIFLVIVCKLYKNFVRLKKIDWNLTREMIRYSVPLIPNYMSWWVNNMSDKFILTALCGTSVNGIYSVAYKIPSLLNSVTSIFASAWSISSVENFGSDESVRFFNRIYGLYSAFLLIMASGLILITKPMGKVLFSNDFFEAWRITPILVLAYVFSALAQQVESIFSASKQTMKIFYASLIGAMVNIILNLLLIPTLTSYGAAIATMIGYITIWAICMKNSRTIMVMDFNLRRIILSSVTILIEIVAVLTDYVAGYFVAAICVCCVLVINYKEIANILEMVRKKFKWH